MSRWRRVSLLAVAAAPLLAVEAAPLLARAPVVAAAEAPERIVAVGDVHGAYDALLTILRAADLVDAGGHWAAGDSVLVQTGDILDRGDEVDRVLDLLQRLREEAAAEGGRVEILLGNHEQMNLLSDFRDVSPGAFAAFADEESPARRERAWETWVAWLEERAAARRSEPTDTAALRPRWLEEHPLGFLEYQETLGPGGRFGAWLREAPVALQFGDVLFLHAGLSPDYLHLSLDEIDARHRAALSAHDSIRQDLVATGVILPFFTLEELNALVRQEASAPRPGAAFAARRAAVAAAVSHLDDLQELLLSEAPLWYRGYMKLSERELMPLARDLAARHGVRHVVSSHSPSEDATIRGRLQGTFFLIDTGMLEEVYAGRPSALEVSGGRFTAIYSESRHVLFEADGDAALAGRSEPVSGAIQTALRPRLVAWQELEPPVEQRLAEAPALQAPSARWYGPDGEPLPFTDEEQVEEFLRTATVVESKEMPEGVIKEKRKLLLERDGVRTRAIFRYHHEEGRNIKLADGSSQMFFIDSYRNEPAAYELSRLLGMRNVPPAVLRTVDGNDGSVQLWIENLITQLKKQEEKIAMPADRVADSNRQVADMDVWDNLVNNIDRHAGNIMWDREWNLWLVDHTRAFARINELVRPEEVTRCSRPLWDGMRSLDEATVRERLEPFLGRFEIRSLMVRRDKVIEKLEQEIDRRGESAVIFTPGEEPPAVSITYDESP